MTNTDTFQPTEIWTPRSENFQLEEAIEDARRQMNAEDPQQLIHELNDQVKRSDNGIVYALLKGRHPEEYSGTDALVMFNPFANTATANMLVRAEFIRRVAENANVRDGEGKIKPVIMLASPGLYGSKMNLSWEERKKLSKGDFGPAAKELLRTVSGLEIGKVALLGYSQGADTAIAGAKISNRSNLDTNSLSIGEPAGVTERGIKKLTTDFFTAAPDIEQRASESGLLALDEARGLRSDYLRFLVSAPYPTNFYRLARGMAHDTFEDSMQSILDEGRIDRIVVGYGDQSTIAPPVTIEPSLSRLHEKIHDNNMLISVKVTEGTHAWGEELTVLAKLYLKALI